jgi:hypothetical protein
MAVAARGAGGAAATRVPHLARCSWVGVLLVAALASPILAAFAADFIAHSLRTGAAKADAGDPDVAGAAAAASPGGGYPCAVGVVGAPSLPPTLHEEGPGSVRRRLAPGTELVSPVITGSRSGTASALPSASCTPPRTVLYPTPHPSRAATGGPPAVAALLLYGLAVDAAGRRANATGALVLPPPRGLCERSVSHHELRTAVLAPVGRPLLLTTAGCVRADEAGVVAGRMPRALRRADSRKCP